MDAKNPINTIRLKSADRMRILEILDEQAADSASNHRVQNRVQTRYDYKVDDVLLKIYGDGLDMRHYSVCARNISSGGMAFLHGGFLHSNTRCEVCLIQQSGTMNKVKGKVVRCRHVAGRIHEIGMVFESKIDVEVYRDPTADQSVPVATDAEVSELPSIDGRVLCIHHDKGHRERILNRLESTGAEIAGASYLGEGLDRIRRTIFDAVICETGLEEARGPASIKLIRKAGFCGGLLSIRKENDMFSVDQLMHAGASRVLTMPLTIRDLVFEVSRMAA